MNNLEKEIKELEKQNKYLKEERDYYFLKSGTLTQKLDGIKEICLKYQKGDE